MGFAWKTHDCLREKKTVRPGPNRLGKMEAHCSALCLPQAPPSWLREVPAVDLLRRVWLQNYQWTEGKLGWRSSDNIPPAGLYSSSPSDLDAHSCLETQHELGG